MGSAHRILFFVLLAGCAAPADGPREDERCLLRVWYRPERALLRSELKLSRMAAFAPELIGSWNQFLRPGLSQFDVRKAEDGERFYTAALPLPPGSYLYGLIVGDHLILDDINPQSGFGRDPRYRDSGPYEAEFSLAEVPGCAAAPAPPETPAPAPNWFADAVIYQVLIDRFRGNEGALPPPRTPGLRAGGTLAGVRKAITAGYFQHLGVNTLWLSPLYQNPPGLHIGRDGHRYEAYHGYWPTLPRTVEPLLGGEAELYALTQAAHAHGLRVLFDAVPNHVYKDHPYYRDHSRQKAAIANDPSADEKSWFNDGPTACVCGQPSANGNCSFGERIEDCWFDSYLPDLNWRHPAVLQLGVEDLLFWLERFDLDGMRIDAVPMMPRAATRRIVAATHRLGQRMGRSYLVLGEDYTGPGAAGRRDIRSFLGQAFDGLDSAFDFPLMWAIRSALATEQSGLDDLEREIADSQAAWAGSFAVMAHMLDNHDMPRFISEAAGNAGNDPWQDPPPQPQTSEPYRKHILGLALLLTLPGMPVLYYGDEIGLAGANDPDSRRTLPDILSSQNGPPLSALQTEVLELSSRLGRLRACTATLRRGSRTVLKSGRDFTVALHTLANHSPVLVVLSRARGELLLPVSGLPAGRYFDVLKKTAAPLVVSGGPVSIQVLPMRPAVYLLDGDLCLSD